MDEEDDRRPVNSSATQGAGRGNPIRRADDGVANPSATQGAGRGNPIRRVTATRYGNIAYSEDIEYKKTKVEVRLTPDPVVSGSAGPCPFGKLLFTTKPNGDREAKIIGGVVAVGDKNFTVPDTDVGSLKISKTRQYYLEIPVEVNRDDASEIFLPGVKTSSGTASTLVKDQPWTETSQYPDNTRPILATGIGKIIIPMGKLVVVGSTESATFTSVACGNISVNHCAGTLSHTRT